MKRFFLLFLLFLWPSLSWGKWEWWKAEQQPLDNTNPGFIVAVGEESKLINVPAHLINNALQEGKEIRIRFARIEGDLIFHGEAEQEIYFLNTVFSGTVNFDLVLFDKSVSFRQVSFLKKVNFNGVLFEKIAYFNKSMFYEEAFFNGAEFVEEAYFFHSQFIKKADFWRGVFKDKVYFQGSKFSEEAYFRGMHFANQANFGGTKFFENVYFRESKFDKDTTFVHAEFFEKADFSDTLFLEEATFQETGFFRKTDFIRTRFSGKANFKETVFNDVVDFRQSHFQKTLHFDNVTFEKRANFNECLFPSKPDALSFSGVSGFSSMLIHWKPQDGIEQKKSANHQCSGIGQCVKYDKTFYLALMKNYQDLGQWGNADEVGFIYRQQENRKNALYKRLPEQIFLEWTFGYGFKPWRLAFTFGLFWFLFAVYYSFWIRNQWGDSIWKKGKYSQKIRFIIWACFHSLNVQLPEINLDSLEHPLLEKDYKFQQNRIPVVHAQYIQSFIGWYLLILFLIIFGSLWVR